MPAARFRSDDALVPRAFDDAFRERTLQQLRYSGNDVDAHGPKQTTFVALSCPPRGSDRTTPLSRARLMMLSESGLSSSFGTAEMMSMRMARNRQRSWHYHARRAVQIGRRPCPARV